MKAGDLVKIPEFGNKIGKIEYTTNKKDVYIVSCRSHLFVLNEKDIRPLDERAEKFEKAKVYLDNLEDLEDSDYTRGYIKGATDMLERLK